MDSGTWLNILLVLVFILIGGVFAGTELALVSLRQGQIDDLAQGSARARRVASIAKDPNRFLAAVQIGVTLAGFFSAAYGASTLASDLAPWFVNLGLSKSAADTTAFIVLTLLIAYLSLVLGELVPKRIALQQSVKISLIVGPPLDRFSALMRPVIWLLSKSTNLVVRLLGADPKATNEQVSVEEIESLVRNNTSLGSTRQKLLNDVFAAGSRTLSEVMRPRGQVTFLEATLPLEDAVALVKQSPYSRYPVIGRDFDEVVGFAHVRDLLAPAADQRTVQDITREITALPGTNKVLPTLNFMRSNGHHFAIVVDEYGGTDGIVTLEDLLEELVGEIEDEYDARVPESKDDRLVDAGLTLEEFYTQTKVKLPEGPYETVAGYIINVLGRLARVGDVVDLDPNTKLVVRAVSTRRITQVLLDRSPFVDTPEPGVDNNAST